MRQRLISIVVLSFVFATEFVGAQAPANRSPNVINPVLNPAIVAQLQAGKTDYFVYNGSDVDEMKLKEIFGRQKEDRDYYLNIVKDADAALKSLALLAIADPTGLAGLSLTSQGQGQTVSLDSFLKARQKYLAQKLVFQNQMDSYASLSQGMFPGQVKLLNRQVTDQQNQVGEIPNYGNLNLEPRIKFYKDRLDAIEATVSAMPFALSGPTGLVYAIPSEEIPNPFVAKFPIKLTQEEYDSKRDLMKKDRTYSRKDHDTLVEFVQYFRRSFNTFIDQYGTSERYRIFSKWNWTEFAQDAQRLDDYFFICQYWRGRFAAQFPFIDYKFQKKWFNLDRFFTTNKRLAETSELLLDSDDDLQKVRNSVLNAIRVSEERTERLTKKGREEQTELDRQTFKIAALDDDISEQIASRGQVTFFSQLNAFGTFVMGNRHLADAILYLMRMIALDLYNEQLVRQPGGHELAFNAFKARYQNTPENREHYGKIFKEISASAGPSKFSRGPSAGGGKSLKGMYPDVEQMLKVRKNFMDEADLIATQLSAFMIPDASSELDKELEDGFNNPNDKK